MMADRLAQLIRVDPASIDRALVTRAIKISRGGVDQLREGAASPAPKVYPNHRERGAVTVAARNGGIDAREASLRNDVKSPSAPRRALVGTNFEARPSGTGVGMTAGASDAIRRRG